MRITGETAFVLHARPWRETSLLVEVLGNDHGRIGLVARGVQGPKRHVLRAALQPLQCIRLDVDLRGELGRLVAAEALDAAPQPAGDAMLAAFYLSELVLRLAPRHDPLPALFEAYAEAREGLRRREGLAWTLRRFECDLLEALGVGLAFGQEADGMAVDPGARYRLDPEEGPRRLYSERAGERRDTATGRALLALADDVLPDADDLASLRLPLRGVLLHHLGGRGLTSWELAGELGRLVPRTPPQRDGG